MKMGQFCGLIADEMDLIHTNFIDAATVLFHRMDEDEGDQLSICYGLPLPDRAPGLQDAALLMFLVAAADRYDGGEAEAIAQYARELAAYGENLPIMLEAIKAREEVEIELPGRLIGSILIQESLMQVVGRIVSSSKPAKLQSV